MNFEWLTLNPIICAGWVIVGIIAGALARRLMGRRNAPFFMDLILGLAGAAVGGLVAGMLGFGPTAATAGLERVLLNLVISVVGAIVLLLIGNLIFGSR
jgi:uncharacterized membrane protein YeaQ/YmgE (transglycosylase-associated protein family)